MKFYSGSYYCSRSHWDGQNYDCNNLVEISNDEYGTTDFDNLVVVKNSVMYLVPKVLIWLNQNVKKTHRNEHGWCIGDENYRKHEFSESGFSLFFYRRKDALNFIKTFSLYKKPTQTYSQRTYILKKLDSKSKKLIIQTKT